MDTTGSAGGRFRLPVQSGPVDAPPPRTGDRRRTDRRGGDRRRGQAAVLHFRRATDRRMDGAQAEALLARRALEHRVQARPVVDLVARELAAPVVAEPVAAKPAPCWCVARSAVRPASGSGWSGTSSRRTRAGTERSAGRSVIVRTHGRETR